jgi:hypothetical protein
MRPISNHAARDYIHASIPFVTHTGSLRGGPRHDIPGNSRYPYPSFAYGYLPREYWGEVDEADYVVMSYATPIAWRNGNVWRRPDLRYSVTTSRHQGLCPLDGARTVTVVTEWAPAGRAE